MGVTELAKQLGCTKGLVSMLVKRGMPTTSVDAANAWRATNAPPRNRKDKREPIPAKPQDGQKVKSGGSYPPDPGSIPGPATPPPPPVSNDTANTPDLSLKRAIEAEDSAHQKRKEIELNNGSIEDYRKANGVYIAARNNRVKAQKDHAEWERLMQITVFSDDAIAMFQRTFGAARQVIDVMPKTMAPRIVGQPQKEIERSLLEWCSRLIETMRANVWPKGFQP